MKRVLFCMTIILGSILSSLAQGSQMVDSLQQVYEKAVDPIEKIRILERLFTAHLYLDPSSALAYPIEALQLSKDNNFTSGIVTSYYNIGVYHNTINNVDSSTYYYRKALEVLEQTDIPHLYAIVISALANHEGQAGNYTEAIRLYEIADSIVVGQKRYLNAGIVRGDIGFIYEQMGYYTLALKNNLHGLSILDSVDVEPFRKADIYRAISSIHSKQGQYEKAMEYQEKALVIYKQTDDYVYEAWTYNDIGTIYQNLKNYPKAIEYYELAIKKAKENNAQEIILDAQSNLGQVYSRAKNYDKALSYLLTSLETYRNFTNGKVDFVLVLNDLARCYAGKKDLKKAWGFAEEATTIADGLENLELKKNVYKLRSTLHQEGGDYVNALKDYKYAQVFQDSLLNEQKNRQLNELHVIYETEQKEQRLQLQNQQITNLEQEVEINRLSRSLLILGLIAVSILAGMVYLVFKNRLRREQQEQKLLQQNIDFKKKELLSQTVHLVEKNTFLQQLSSQIETAIQTPNRLKSEVEKLLLYLRREQAEDQNWEAFKSYFTEIHDDFNQKLRTQSQEDVTEKEVRLAAFLRMNLSTKEIAALLNVLPDSVLKSKYRLKKKLALSKEQDLQRFLEEI